MLASLLIVLIEFVGVYIVFKIIVGAVKETFDALFGGFRKSKHTYDNNFFDNDLFDDDSFDNNSFDDDSFDDDSFDDDLF